MADESSVKVAVRIRPLVENEISKGCQDILEVYPALEQVRIKNSDKAFTFNYVLDSNSSQSDLYSRCSRDLIKNLFNGYNVTILAYGQTGSGKTYSMGTSYKEHEDMGVIPRAVHHIFEIMRDKFSFDFTLTVSFMELYQESLFDLLSDKPREQSQLDIREDPTKGIVIQGLVEHLVKTPDQILECLMKGSQGRATGATNMNAHSSRSHAIFTIDITMYDKNNLKDRKTARFTLVDLAGSERFKKTGAVGITFKEGININKGLLVLGNVISALGDDKHQHNHIPYRDSNLTRLLKDSLGGNSITLMIACVSPADYNLEETLSTLRYADRARKIKNKPIVNQDSKVAEIIELKKTIQQLRLQILGQGETVLYPGEVDALRKETKEQKEKIRSLTFQLSSVLSDNTCLLETIHMLQSANETLKNRLKDLKNDYDTTLSDLSLSNLQENPQLKANVEKLQLIQKKILDMDFEQQKTVQEVHKLETTFSILHHSRHDRQEPSDEIEITEKRAVFANKQMALKTELESISAQLVMKESLAAQLQLNVQNMVNLTVMRETEDKIARLEQEKNELLQQLRLTQRDNQSKLAEQRRKRVQELESELQGLKKKVQEQARLIKMKEKEELKIKRLASEIAAIKQEKVKLIRNMRQEADRFRMWRLQKERELAKLKQEDRKKLTQIKKMETLQEKQQNVLKRKVEEVATLNKKLNKAMNQRKLVQEQRLGGKSEKITDWLKNELGLLTNIIEVDSALSDLLEDRAVLQQQLDKLKNDPLNYDPEQIKLLQDEIEIRSLQIQDSQQKLLDFNEDSDTAKSLWENIHSMVEAKIALRTLWETIANVKKNEIVSLNNNKQLLSKLEELSNHIERLSKQNNILIQAHAEESANLQKDYEERVCVLLKRLQGKASNEELEQIISLQLEQNKKLEEECKELNEKLNELKDNLEKEKSKEFKMEEMPAIPLIKIEKTPENRSGGIRRIAVNKNRPNLFEMAQNTKENQEKENESKDEAYEDTDWRRTPIGKRVLKDRQKVQLIKVQMGMRRCVEDACSCEDICGSSCTCKRSSNGCFLLCNCSLGCENRGMNENGSYSEENVTSPYHTSSAQGVKKTRTTKYFKLSEAP